MPADSLSAEPQGMPKNNRVGSLSLLQKIFPTQEFNRGLLDCSRILYQLSYQERPSACNAGDLGSTPGSRRGPGEGNRNPLQYSCLENPIARVTRQDAVHAIAESQTRLKNKRRADCRPWASSPSALGSVSQVLTFISIL